MRAAVTVLCLTPNLGGNSRGEWSGPAVIQRLGKAAMLPLALPHVTNRGREGGSNRPAGPALQASGTCSRDAQVAT